MKGWLKKLKGTPGMAHAALFVRSMRPITRLPPFDLGRSQGMAPGEFDPEELAAGIFVEMEHVGKENVLVAMLIAMDHLAEIPDYYTRLMRMEHEAGVEIGGI